MLYPSNSSRSNFTLPTPHPKWMKCFETILHSLHAFLMLFAYAWSLMPLLNFTLQSTSSFMLNHDLLSVKSISSASCPLGNCANKCKPRAPMGHSSTCFAYTHLPYRTLSPLVFPIAMRIMWIRIGRVELGLVCNKSHKSLSSDLNRDSPLSMAFIVISKQNRLRNAAH